MAKRVRIKIGDILCQEVEASYKRFFQFIAIDLSELGGDTIAVYRKSYPIDYHPDVQEIINDDVDFYAHTVIGVGVRDGLWQKVGRADVMIDPSTVFFKAYQRARPPLNRPEEWSIWAINKQRVYVGDMTKELFDATHWEGMCPPNMISDRIIEGKYKYRSDNFNDIM